MTICGLLVDCFLFVDLSCRVLYNFAFLVIAYEKVSGTLSCDNLRKNAKNNVNQLSG